MRAEVCLLPLELPWDVETVLYGRNAGIPYSSHSTHAAGSFLGARHVKSSLRTRKSLCLVPPAVRWTWVPQGADGYLSSSQTSPQGNYSHPHHRQQTFRPVPLKHKSCCFKELCPLILSTQRLQVSSPTAAGHRDPSHGARWPDDGTEPSPVPLRTQTLHLPELHPSQPKPSA